VGEVASCAHQCMLCEVLYGSSSWQCIAHLCVAHHIWLAGRDQACFAQMR
jgi:hypothetical protein